MSEHEARRGLRSGLNRVMMGVVMTPILEKVVLEKCAQYGLTRSVLIRSVLEMVDDEDLWERLLGPASNEEKR